jgi:3-oxoacyl-[acyl-carrier protein] reductase
MTSTTSGTSTSVQPSGPATDRRPLAGRVAVVTGAAHGIGRAYAERLVADGAAVVVADLDGEGAERVAGDLRATGAPAIAVAVDVSDEESLGRMRDEALRELGRIDVLVNYAAVFMTVPMSRVGFEDVPVAEWDRMMEVNVKGVWLACRAVVPAMRAQGYGKIINVSSDTVFKGSPLRIHYVTSKSALLGFTRTLAGELGAAGIRVNAVAPGIVLSQEQPGPDAESRRAAAVAAQVLPEALLPADMAGTIAFLASPDSDAITGQVLVVNAGGYMR